MEHFSEGDVREVRIRVPVRLSHMAVDGGVFGEGGLGLGSGNRIHCVHSSSGYGFY